jgi:uncharacterized protein YggE
MYTLPYVAAALVVIAVAGAAYAQSPPAEPPRDVVVTTGEAVVKRAADEAFVVVAAENRAKSPAEAQKATAAAMTGVLQALKRVGLAGEAVRTLQYELQPEFDYAGGRQTLRGYVARNSVEVRVEPIERVGEIVDLAVQSGAATVTNLRFDVKGREALEQEALAKAVQAARGRADAAAKGAGRTIERIVKIEDQGLGDTLPRPYMAAMRGEAAAPQTPIAPGEVEIRARVTLTAQLR